MKQIGISIYPEKSTLEKDLLYLEKAGALGYSRLFLSLLEINGSQEDIIKQFQTLILRAKELGFEVVLDINPSLFGQLNISYHDLSFFHKLGADAIRLDLGFSGVEEAAMSHNPFDIKIDINMSHGTCAIDNIMSREPRQGYIIGSHNFYLHRYTGLEWDFFLKTSKKFKSYCIPTTAFISSQVGDFGPWPMQEGICTLEHHRDLPIETQAAQLMYSGLIDCVVIANAYASDDELKKVAQVAKTRCIPIRVSFYDTVSDLERSIVLDSMHIYRGEKNPYLIRTKSDQRKRYKDKTVAGHNQQEINYADITINNDLYLQYKGELQIAKQARPADIKVNKVAKIIPEDHTLLETLRPWQTFRLVEQDKRG